MRWRYRSVSAERASCEGDGEEGGGKEAHCGGCRKMLIVELISA